MRAFVKDTCSEFDTKELAREYQARKRREAKQKAKKASQKPKQKGKPPAKKRKISKGGSSDVEEEPEDPEPGEPLCLLR